MHALICQRFAEINRERDTRRQKILNLLSGYIHRSPTESKENPLSSTGGPGEK
jgi:hypothetical protein